MHKKIFTSLIVIVAIAISLWQTKIYFSHAANLPSTVTVTGGGGSSSSGGPIIPASNVFISGITAHPEKRAGSVGTNYDYKFSFEILNSSSRQTLYLHQNLLELNSSGVYSTPIELTDISPGVYDIAIKTDAHLTVILNDISLVAGNNNLNFTNAVNSPIDGSITMKAGDINGTGVGIEGFGDNIINAVDLSVLLGQIGTSDATGSNKANLNQDDKVDASDLNILLANLDLEGDH